jgi:pyruvate formate lyase activating enzyme
MAKVALYFEKQDKGIICTLCPHHCLIQEGKTGICKVRRNVGDQLIAETYGKLSAINFDPIEKKPLYHFHPGKMILSLGSIGCNMKCQCCQNWQISQSAAFDLTGKGTTDPADLILMARSRKQNIGIAYTYNEPTVWFEFMLDTAKLVHDARLKNVMVSNGYLAVEPLQELIPCMDAFNIDLKSFSEEFYRKHTGGRLDPVLQTLKEIRRAGRHLEVTYLVIPSLNDGEDQFRDMVGWIKLELGNNTVLHLSRYHPAYKMNIEPTTRESLEGFYNIAREKLHYVYVGNLPSRDFQDTFCTHCGRKVIARSGYEVDIVLLTSGGACRGCGNQIVINV